MDGPSLVSQIVMTKTSFKIQICKGLHHNEQPLTGCSTAYDLWQVKQPVSDVLVFECNAAEMFSAVDVPRSNRHTEIDWPHVVSITLDH